MARSIGPSLTIVLPTYNRANHLDKALESLSRCKGFDEIILIDDGSTDDTANVVRKWMGRCNIRYLKHERRMGTSHSFNEGIDASNCDLVFFSADDLVFPGTDLFTRLREHFKREDIGIVGCRVIERKGACVTTQFRVKKDDGTSILLTNLKKMQNGFTGFIDTNMTYVTGAMGVRRSICSNVKFSLDYQGNCNYEELDFQKRVHKLGYKIFYDGSLIIEHMPALSGGYRRFTEKEYLYWHYRNRMIYLLRHSKWRLLFFPALHILRNELFHKYPKTFLRACFHGFIIGI